MCGILGAVDLTSNINKSHFENMLDILAHRGPDDKGIFYKKPVILGHRRLSIIDTSPAGHQPMSDKDGIVWIVYNGEVYNFLSIRKELETKGYTLRSRADTEVVLNAYKEWGIDCLHKFNGMFAFCICDLKNKLLFLARDRFGIKPLVYYFDNKKFIFSSEIKGFLLSEIISKEIDWEAFWYYIHFGYIPAPLTIYKKIKKLEPGYYILVSWQNNSKLQFIKKRWYHLPIVNFSQKLDINEIKETLFSLVSDAVKLRLISDVPLGAFLSGGIDSSIIAGLMIRHSNRAVKTFSIGYKEHEMFDETSYAREVAKFNNTEHYEFKLTYQDILDIIPIVLDHLDAPFSDWSIFPTFLVSQKTRQHVTVALSGDGADELFAGYRKYQGEFFWKYYSLLPSFVRKKLIKPFLDLFPDSYDNRLLEYVRRAKKFLNGLDDDPARRHFNWMCIFSNELLEQLINDPVLEIDNISPFNFVKQLFGRYKGDFVNRMLYTDINICLPYDMLVKVDWMSMLNSLEVRVPFLDHRVVEFVFQIPGNLKLNKWKRKYILIETFKDILPPKLYHRSKQGFDVPIGEWFKKELKPLFWEIVNESSIKKQGLFNFDFIKKMYHLHISNKKDFSKQLLAIFIFEWWYRKNYEK